MDFSLFKQDIDQLIQEFAEEKLTALSDMKRFWLDRKFSYIFEARPSTNLALFMQALYYHSISYMDISNSLYHRLGALYCLYCLYETQPFKPSFKIYLSLGVFCLFPTPYYIFSASCIWEVQLNLLIGFAGDLQWLKALVVDAKSQRTKVVSAVIKRMLEKNAFLFGFVDINEYSKKEKIKELVDVQKACVQKMNEKLFANTDPERYLHMDMGMELDLEVLLKISKEYEATKSLAIQEASKEVDVQNIEHIAEDRPTIGDEVQDIIKEWGNQKEVFSQQTASTLCPAITPPEEGKSQGKQPISLPSGEGQLHDDDDDELRHTSFMELLFGNESPQANGDLRHSRGVEDAGAEEDTESEFAKELEFELFQDF
ncbi:hypothetical protein Cgig2_023730 [Carnegiea gigantea]|uniref:snRNA-activating protein complex subunit 1 n=1 Tax=Carnegiea gigantea TaxID=171969 RepID=A0A9Q1KK13_9CARY|nr:hypothetical protein Cgig2_023730 [Carnegiea gigantea]